MSPAGWLWIVLILEIGVIDGLLALAGGPTLSQWLWRQYRKHRWSKWVVLGLLVVAALHLVWGWFGGPSAPPPPPPYYPIDL